VNIGNLFPKNGFYNELITVFREIDNSEFDPVYDDLLNWRNVYAVRKLEDAEVLFFFFGQQGEIITEARLLTY